MRLRLNYAIKKNFLSEIPRQTDGNHGQNLVSLDIKGALEDSVDL